MEGFTKKTFIMEELVKTNLQIFIAGSVTSNLFSVLLPVLLAANYQLYATARGEASGDRVVALNGFIFKKKL